MTDPRVELILDALQDLAAGDLERRIPISSAHDELDGIAHAINMVAAELAYTNRQLATALEQAKQAIEAKAEFFRNVSHELRTPLTVILSTAELLQMLDADDEERSELHARIISNVDGQIELLNDLLDLSQLDSGKLALDMRPIRVHTVLDEIAASFKPAVVRKALSLAVERTTDLAVLADRRRLRQILVNLLGNAIKFTERGGSIKIDARRDDQGVVIDVTDTGIGIDPIHVARLFEPFAQADLSITRRFGGSGLGLAISRRLAREMSGDLTIVASKPGAGATLRLALPALESPEVPSDRTPSRASERLSLDGIRVLLVDDHPDIRQSIAMLLAGHDANVVEAASGNEALEICTRHSVDVILMDLRMPEIDGLEAARRLRAQGVRVPIVAITADALAGHSTTYAEAGCTALMAKPIDIARLVTTMRSLLATRP